MDRLQTEFDRLYRHPVPAGAKADDRVRALVLELARPAQWDVLARVWHGVQADLEWPAPAIAVSGLDGYQLWFSLAEPVPATEGLALLEALRRMHLSDTASSRIRCLAGVCGDERADPGQARAVPAQQPPQGHWSAFVASDLARIFEAEPWLDRPPNPDAQADLLARMQSISQSDWQRAWQRLSPSHTAHPSSSPYPLPAPAHGVVPDPGDATASAAQSAQAFLLGVMNDPQVELSWRIEAAKALLGAPDPAKR